MKKQTRRHLQRPEGECIFSSKCSVFGELQYSFQENGSSMFLSKSVLSSWAELWLFEDVYTIYIIYFKDHNILTKIMIKTQIRFAACNWRFLTEVSCFRRFFFWDLSNLTYHLEFQNVTHCAQTCTQLCNQTSDISVWTQMFVFNNLDCATCFSFSTVFSIKQTYGHVNNRLICCWVFFSHKQKHTLQSWCVNERATSEQGEERGGAGAAVASFSKSVLVVCWELL